MELVDGVIRNYEWGSPTAIPELLGRPATGQPAAELWLGAHPSGAALVGSDHLPLDRVVAADPTAALGSETEGQFGGTLPFLLKVLAAAAPLSLQAHPSTIQAEAGFAREDAAAIALDAPNRSFRDRRHKPELICALTDFEALCGFRDPALTLDVLASVATPALDPVVAGLRENASPSALVAMVEWLLSLDDADADALVLPVVAACGADAPEPFRAERAVAAALGARYPGDAGVVVSLLLNLVTLRPGQALFLGAGNLHAYLHGTGVEIMAASDNVLRGGLTSKHVDIPALVEILDGMPMVPDVQHPDLVDGVASYAAPIPDFALERIEFDGTHTMPSGPAIVLCTAGRAETAAHVLDRGSAAWIPASDGPATLTGAATLFRASPGI